jgi:dihydrofolate reductase
MTHRPFTPGTPHTQVWTGDVGMLADRLALETRSGDIWVMGGGAVARAFLASGRLDALELAYIPILLGEGIPLFGPGTPRARLKLLTTERFKSGIVRVDYAVER